MKIIPQQLQDPTFRFYLIRKEGNNPGDGKLPLEKQWNDTNNYMFFEEKLQRHKDNYGVCCGYGNLVVLDFDDKAYYDQVKVHLPETFTVLSAGKRLPHMYYILKGVMFKKTSVRNAEGKTLMDVQADRSGVVAPGSVINRRYYSIYRDVPIAVISSDYLATLFKIKTVKHKEYTGTRTVNNYLVNKTMDLMALLKIERTGLKHYKCPFHKMHGKGNLTVMDNGALYCFHEQKYWGNIEQFAQDWSQFTGDNKMYEMVKIITKKWKR